MSIFPCSLGLLFSFLGVHKHSELFEASQSLVIVIKTRDLMGALGAIAELLVMQDLDPDPATNIPEHPQKLLGLVRGLAGPLDLKARAHQDFPNLVCGHASKAEWINACAQAVASVSILDRTRTCRTQPVNPQRPP